MPVNEEKLLTLSGREYPPGWDKLYNGKMSYWQSLFFIIKFSLWNIALKPSKRVSIWLVRLMNPIVWFLLYAFGLGSFLPLIVVGFFGLILSVLAFEHTVGMEHRLIFLWGISVPFVLMISPLLALFIMGGGNKKGLGKPSSWNDHISITPLTQVKTGRSYVNPK